MSKTFQVQNQTSQEGLVHSYPGNCMIRFVNRISIACQKFQFSKFWSEKFSKKKLKIWKNRLLILSNLTAFQTKIKTTFGRFCLLTCGVTWSVWISKFSNRFMIRFMKMTGLKMEQRLELMKFLAILDRYKTTMKSKLSSITLNFEISNHVRN